MNLLLSIIRSETKGYFGGYKEGKKITQRSINAYYFELISIDENVSRQCLSMVAVCLVGLE